MAMHVKRTIWMLARSTHHEHVQVLGVLACGCDVCRADAPPVVQEPTAAATQAGMQALVVSAETVPGAQAINQDRGRRAFLPLAIIVVHTVGTSSKGLDGQKLSSTALRAKEAADRI